MKLKMILNEIILSRGCIELLIKRRISKRHSNGRGNTLSNRVNKASDNQDSFF